ncbi:3'-5' exonuclease [Marinobacter sp.]|uniref:3'-5' exonuclease n=1 Tax=Marinobacter sp. TaxID=50741 RepID=UPI00384BBCAA
MTDSQKPTTAEPANPRMAPWPERMQKLAQEAVNPQLKSFYEAGCVDPSTPVAEVPMVALDFETTGLDPNEHSIVSIGLVPMNLQRIHCQQAKHWIVRPPLPLQQKSITIHGITHSDIDQAPDLAEILDDLLAALAGRVVVVHHRGIERPFLDVALRWRLREGIEFPVIDTMAIEAAIHPRRQPGWFDRIRGKSPVSIRLPDCRERYGLPYYSPHHALSDALASAELLQAQIQYHFSEKTPVGELWH